MQLDATSKQSESYSKGKEPFLCKESEKEIALQRVGSPQCRFVLSGQRTVQVMDAESDQ